LTQHDRQLLLLQDLYLLLLLPQTVAGHGRARVCRELLLLQGQYPALLLLLLCWFDGHLMGCVTLLLLLLRPC
jgi:hypothetical protein